ncbi:MAG: ATP-binding protein [Desulfurococcales archaeon ex4484_58]|nr:MAG: ATP-binding protein [Desulfurococcales archaeon ex4484_58]
MANVVSFDRGLPVVVYEPYCVSPDEVFNMVRKGYIEYYGEKPDWDLLFSWKTTIPTILRAADNYPVIIEYPILGGLERVDYIIVGKKKALIIEAKSWIGEYRRVGRYFICSDPLGLTRLDPCYQLENYVAKFKYLHSAGSKLDFQGLVFTYGFKYVNGCYIVKDQDRLTRIINSLGNPGGYIEVDYIVNGRFQISKTLVEYIRDNKEKLLENAIKALVGGGYGLTEKQLLIVEKVLESLENGEDKAYIIRGVSGSGKTLVALTLFFEALSKGYRVLLTYKNNRLLNTLRRALGKISGFILFYSTGPQGRYRGVAERNFPVDKYGKLDLVIYDEAQRMTRENIELSMIRSRVKIYLYDDEQVLIGYEEGICENFTKAAGEQGIKYSLYELPKPVRIPESYLETIRNLLTRGVFEPGFKGIDFRIYDDIVEMINDLRKKYREGYRIALVASFTETPGNKENRRAPDNLRIGYPLCMKYRGGRCIKYSDLDIYRDTGLEIYWLMDEKEEYPRYWMGLLDPLKYCASVYGAQGFEAEYVGVIWGRDLVWRNSRWEVNPDVITDYVGGKDSLKQIARRDKNRAYKLLVNRYIILLTRGTKGTYVFFEDNETREYIKSFIW